MNYRLLHNLDARCFREWTPGDRFAEGHSGEMSGPWCLDVLSTLDEIFRLHNSSSRPDGQTAPSLSIGDVVILAESAWCVARRGWAPASIRSEDLDSRSWLEASEAWA